MAANKRIRELIEQTVSPMGYELVDVEFAASGVLRAFIDHDGSEQAQTKLIQVEDCERVSHQLSHVFEVEQVDYARLEISSPGLDRPLRTAAHFKRFAGEQVSVRLREPFEGRRNFAGLLTDEGNGQFGLEMFDEQPRAGKSRRGKSRPAVRVTEKQAKTKDGVDVTPENKEIGPTDASATTSDGLNGRKLVFAIDEVERARLVPTYEFRRHG